MHITVSIMLMLQIDIISLCLTCALNGVHFLGKLNYASHGANKRSDLNDQSPRILDLNLQL